MPLLSCGINLMQSHDRPKKPSAPPTLVAIIDNYKALHRYAMYANHIAFGSVAIGLILLAPGVAAFQWLALLAFVFSGACLSMDNRWNKQARKTSDANLFLPNTPLTDARDLQWIAWFCDVEPRASTYLRQRRPNACFTARDLLALYVTKTSDEIDAAYSAPYTGNSEDRYLDLEIRRAKERRALQTQ